MTLEKIMIGKDTQYPLNGILTLPDSAETPVPAAVLVHGSGSSDMNEHVGKLYPFTDIAEGLAKYGIASVRYDKRSFAHGRKMVKSEEIITVREETILDAVAAADLLRNDSRIDPDRIFIIGHSMGAMLAPRIDAEGGGFRGLILMAGSPYSLDEILIRQLKNLSDEYRFPLKNIIQSQYKKFAAMFETMENMTEEEAKKKKMGGGTTLWYFREMKDHPVSSYLNGTDKPILVMQGEKDFQCLADTDFKAYQELLGDRDNVTYRLYPELNHCFVHSVYGKASKANKEYSLAQSIPEEVLSDIASWIHSVSDIEAA